jgi:hypothetical protein
VSGVIIPETGLVTVTDLSDMLGVGVPSLIQKLERKNIPIFKVAQYHRSWLVSLTEIAKFCRGGPDV